jgi:polyhydroxyalkanoate synthase
MESLCQTQFSVMDTLRRAQGDALELFGCGPDECNYYIVSSGPYWRLREYTCGYAETPLLIIPAPIKRPYIWDLAPSVSAVRHCLDHRLHVYLLEWLPSSGNGQQAGLADYADYAISECVAKISSEAQGTPPFLMGHSLGGTLAAIFCALEQESVQGLVLLGAPLCFAPGSSQFRDALVALVPQTALGAAVVPGSLLSQVSALASPNTFIWARLKDAALGIMNPPACEICARVERWALDEVPLPGQLVAEIFQLLYRENRFCQGSLLIRDRSLGPSCIQVPTLAIINTADEIAPLKTVKPFLDAIPIKATRIIEYPGEAGIALQHLALLVGRQAHACIWPEIVSWLRSPQ